MKKAVRVLALFCMLAMLTVNIAGCQAKENISTPTDSDNTSKTTEASGAESTNSEPEDPNVNKPNITVRSFPLHIKN